jgi:hypothetical protein
MRRGREKGRKPLVDVDSSHLCRWFSDERSRYKSDYEVKTADPENSSVEVLEECDKHDHHQAGDKTKHLHGGW